MLLRSPLPSRSPLAARSIVRFDSTTAKSILCRQGLGSLDAVFRAATGAQERHVGRSVWKVELCDLEGERFAAFVKMSWGRRRWWPRMNDLRTGQVFKSLAMREWEGLAQFSHFGLRVPQRLALFEEGWLWKRSALIVRAVPPPASISDMVANGSWLRLSLDERRELLESVLATLKQIHDAGFGWRCISTRHVFPQRTAGGQWVLWLIDCEGVHPARSAAVRERDFRKFERALQHDRVDAASLRLLHKVGEESSRNSRRCGFAQKRGLTL